MTTTRQLPNQQLCYITEQPHLNNMETTRQKIEAAEALERDHNWTAKLIIETLRNYEGKKLTRRILPAVGRVLGQEVTLDDSYGMLRLQTEAYWRNKDNPGPGAVSLSIPVPLGSTTLPIVNIDEITEANERYLSAALERNNRRAEMLNSDTPERIDAALAAIAAATEELERLTEYPCPDWSTLRKA